MDNLYLDIAFTNLFAFNSYIKLSYNFIDALKTSLERNGDRYVNEILSNDSKLYTGENFVMNEWKIKGLTESEFEELTALLPNMNGKNDRYYRNLVYDGIN